MTSKFKTVEKKIVTILGIKFQMSKYADGSKMLKTMGSNMFLHFDPDGNPKMATLWDNEKGEWVDAVVPKTS